MGTQYLVQNAAMPTTAPMTPVTTSATLYTMIQIVPATNSPLDIVEFEVSFNGSSLAASFPVELVETGTVAATVTAYAAADVMPYSDPNAPANTAGASGVPLNLGTALSGFTSSAEGSTTTCRVFTIAQVDPAMGYLKQYPLGNRPRIKPGNVLRLRIKGDGTIKVTASILFEV